MFVPDVHLPVPFNPKGMQFLCPEAVLSSDLQCIENRGTHWEFCFTNMLLIQTTVNLDRAFKASMEKAGYTGDFILCILPVFLQKNHSRSPKNGNCITVSYECEI